MRAGLAGRSTCSWLVTASREKVKGLVSGYWTLLQRMLAWGVREYWAQAQVPVLGLHHWAPLSEIPAWVLGSLGFRSGGQFVVDDMVTATTVIPWLPW